ncbi:hypothetical protein Sjap_024872 [Stephania japonica]|uniref:J domain-containing protein n=1 Tax=Stephania japonica TaxID=461633 RepID=A0AAP0HQI5_9MAGN
MDFEEERSGSYYAILGVRRNSSAAEIRRAYHKLAMRWHPDRWIARSPSLLGEAKVRFQQIQEAYAVLSDQRKRSTYDAGLYNPDEDENDNNGFSEFLQEMLSLMANVRSENKVYSLEELEQMLREMAQGFTSQSQSTQQWSDQYTDRTLEDSRDSKRTRWSSSHVHVSGLGMCR